MGNNGKLGQRIADIVTRAHYAHKRQYQPELVNVFMAMQEAFFTLTGSEHKVTTGGFWRALADRGDLPEWAQATAHFLGHEHGQWQTMLAGQATGMAMGAGITAALNNDLAPATQRLIRANPNGLLAPGDLATAVAHGVMDIGDAIDQSERSGLSEDKLRILIQTNQQTPPPSDLADLLQRKEIGDDEFVDLCERAGLDPSVRGLVKALARQILTPDQLAALVTFGVLTQDQATPMAAQSGMDAADFGMLVLGNGQPPSTEDLLFAYRRKIIDQARLLRGIKQGPVRDEWFDVVESLGQVPMSTSDAIEAAVQGHLSQAQAQTIAEQNGLVPDQFAPLFETAGSPPGPQQVLDYVNRGWMTEAEGEQALTESRLKPKYVAITMRSREKLLPLIQIREAVEHGSIAIPHALDLMEQHGYTPEDAAIVLASATASKTSSAKALTQAQILELRQDRAITVEQATQMLEALGYTEQETVWLLDIADLNRLRVMTSAVITQVRGAYIHGVIDDGVANTALDAVGIPPDQKTDLIELWDIEKTTVTKTLTQAQCSAALKAGAMDVGDFSDRLTRMGYGAPDITILQALATPKPKTT